MSRLKQSLCGTGKVFSFTFIQFCKNRANCVSLLVILLFALLSFPIATLAAGGSFTSREKGYTGAVYVWDETGLPLDLDEAPSLDGYFAETVFVSVSEAVEEGVCAHLYQNAAGLWAVDLAISGDSALPAEKEGALAELFSGLLRLAQNRLYGVTAQQQAVLDAACTVSVSTAGDYLAELSGEGGSSWETQYWLQLIYAILVMMVSIFSVSYIIRAVVEEKASKLVELLMVSVQPLALIVGKILAAMLYVLLMFLLLFAGFALSYVLTGLFLDTGALLPMLSGWGISLDALRIGPGTLGVILVSLLLGYLTFAILAGLSGTGCSTMEEIQDATGTSTLLIMGGYIVSIFVGAAESNTAAAVCSLIPVLSVFCAPVQYITGTIGFGLLCLSWLLQAGVIVLLALFCAKVYRSLLIHRGSRVKLRQMLAMAGFGKRKEAV